MKLADMSNQMRSQEAILDWQLSLQSACFDAVTAQDVQEIVRNQVAKAKDGDPNAIKFVMGHLLGSGRPVTIQNTQIITDVEGAAKLAAARARNAS
jgi:hypothetical protein